MKWTHVLSLILEWIGIVIWIASLGISYSYGKKGIYWTDSWELMALIIVGYLFIVNGERIWSFDE